MIIYDIIFIAFSIFYIPFSICKKGFRSFNVRQRLGFIDKGVKDSLRQKKNIWIHAVSVGEAMVLGAFIEKMKKELPGFNIVLTTTTSAGNYVASKNFGDKAAIFYSPFDLSFAVKRFFRIIRPEALIIVETEIWPNLMRVAKRQGVPVVIINGRVSPRSFKRYKLIKPLLKSTFKKIDLFCMQSEEDADRIIAIGAEKDKVKITGNMKFDISLEYRVQSTEYRERLGLSEKDILIVAGSTHKGEEEILLDVYKNLSKKLSNIKILIAPRHINRIPEIKKLTKNVSGAFLLDTIGQLKDFYSIADIVFIGGSLVPHGGQNPIEPAYFSKPIIFGPYMFNFSQIARILINGMAAIEIKDKKGLEEAMSLLINDPKRARAMGVFAKKSIEENRGASIKNFELIKNIMSR